MFGFSFGEIMVLAIVGIIVVGPRRLPAMMRSAGSWIAKLRRLSTDLRTQSGIDDLIRQEGLERELRELRALSRVNVLETLVNPVVGAVTAGAIASSTPRVRPPDPEPPPPVVNPPREREYPVLGCDAYGVTLDAAPDGAAGLPVAPESASPTETAKAADATVDVESTAATAPAAAEAVAAIAPAAAETTAATATAAAETTAATAPATAETTAATTPATAETTAATAPVAAETTAASQGVVTGNGATS
ncbi:Sec-independent protein translocase protein TatB [Sorangium sp. So ce117]|uniref:Sec-independent protein translocase protein TatB n=1 Tax=Sorangium sp. So ce117 TaxID=3133277 RepID=UPI003F61BE36